MITQLLRRDSQAHRENRKPKKEKCVLERRLVSAGLIPTDDEPAEVFGSTLHANWNRQSGDLDATPSTHPENLRL